jgi:hypothetical protein
VKRLGAASAAGVALFVVYALTLAPEVTFWDAGEFIAAAHSLGIPHPPGTPLFILLINVWAKALFFLPYAVATNLFSAAATALAAYLTARLIQQGSGTPATAAAAAIAAGSMSSVWLNATETEVYAASLALGVLTVWAGDRAGRGQEGAEGRRYTMLTAYLIALAVPLHLSALVAAPVAIALASWWPGRVHWRRAMVLGGTLVLAMGVGRMSPWLAAAGAVIMVAAQPRAGLPALALAIAGVTALGFLYVRAGLDPAINQGDPASLAAFTDMVARRQYDVAPIWPRKAPLWIQFGNLGQYADWQTALSLGPTVLPSVLRTAGTVLFVALGFHGARTQWRRAPRGFLGVAGLLACGAVGVLVYLNLHPGPSIGWGILPEGAPREARERDYFYVFAFWAWGIWAGIGAVALARRSGRPPWAGVALVCLPIALNWRAVTRRGEPDQSLPLTLATALLESAPRDAVLFVIGDNDSYPVWYAQQVKGLRRDVAVITMPLLPTRWYRSQIATRYALLDSAEAQVYDGRMEVSARIAAGARARRRPVAVAMTVSARDRQRLGAGPWTASGLVYVEGAAPVDSAASARLADWVQARLGDRPPREGIDPVNSHFRRVLNCPRQLLVAGQHGDSTRLDSVCNYR